MVTTLFGIRHHGPGSARSLVRSLHALKPDIVLIEGPPEATETLSLLANADTQPPVALLIYPPDHLQQSAYYPFAIFSPEWQAIQYALTQQVPARFIDLPQTHQIAVRIAANEQAEKANGEIDKGHIIHDPLGMLAEAAGYTDKERWWEHMVEQRQDSTALFEGILEAMSAIRTDAESAQPPDLSHPYFLREAQREAHMRKMIRKAKKEGFENIAVVCGAWHTPALREPFPTQKEDNVLLKNLPKIKVKATWIPWTYARLSTSSGYGAGISSPGWYEHLWHSSTRSHSPTQSAIHWLTKVARLLRAEDLDASSASVIESLRLAEALAAIREASMPGLSELTEATQTVLCFGDPTPLKLIHRKLIVSDRIGQVSEKTPLIPLQQNLQQLQKRLRLKPTATEKPITLDLRKEIDLERSHLLHRLRLLNINWGTPQTTSGKGTFKEAWKLVWEPELSVAIIEAGRWGNTVADAAIAYVCHQIENTGEEESADLPLLTRLLDRVLLANLPEAVTYLMHQLQNAAAVASDVTHLMGALPPLVNVLRYRDVRQTDSAMVSGVVDGLVTRICIGLPGACASLDDAAAEKMLSAIASTHSAIKRLQQSEHALAWSAVLRQLCDHESLYGLIAGYSCRLLLDEGSLSTEEAARRLNLALSIASEPAQAAAWVEGFLKGSGLLLLHDDVIWKVLDDWLIELSNETFIALLPLLRRTFSQFSPIERRQMGERVRVGQQAVRSDGLEREFDCDRANQSLPLLAQLMGLSFQPSQTTP